MTVGSDPVVRSTASPGRVISDWTPEDPGYWERTGKRVATRNLVISIPSLLLAFSVWVLFSAVTISLPKIGFGFSTDQLFWLVALPSLSGATLRIFYSFVIPIFGGRRCPLRRCWHRRSGWALRCRTRPRRTGCSW